MQRTGGKCASCYDNKIAEWDIAPRDDYFDELFRVSKCQIIWGGNYFTLPPTRMFIVWRKTNIPIEGFSMAPCEYAWTNMSGNCAVYECPSLRGKNSGGFHPTEKPISLYEWIFRKFAAPGIKVLDTHLGSGSSRIAAYEYGLDFVGCEIDKEYFEAQEKRFSEYTSQTSIMDIVERNGWEQMDIIGELNSCGGEQDEEK